MMTDAIKSLARYAARLSDLCNDGGAAPIATALHQPDRCAAKADQLSVVQKDTTWGRDSDLIKEATQIKAAIKAEFRRQGEVKRETDLAAIEAEIETIRAVICNIAAKAAIEAGAVAREVRGHRRG